MKLLNTLLCIFIVFTFVNAQDAEEQIEHFESDVEAQFSVKKIKIDLRAEKIAVGTDTIGIVHGNGLVSLINMKTEQLIGTVTAGGIPEGITFARNKFAVLNFDGPTDVINMATKAVTHLIPKTKGFDGGSIATNGSHIATLGHNGSIKIFSAINNATLADKISNHQFNNVAFLGNFVYGISSNSNKIIKISLRGVELESIDVESSPLNIIASGTKLYVANQKSNSISIIEKDKVIDRKIVGTNPDGMAVGLKKVAVACNDGTLRIIKAEGFDTVVDIGSFTRFSRVAFGNNKFAVLNHTNATVTFVDAKKTTEVKIGSVKVGSHSKDIVFASGKFIVLDSNGSLYIISDK